jgi:lactate dehydrogenase-like 2-hydroxyacid dehydrogenase
MEVLTARGIWYCNTPDVCTEDVPNTGLALVLETFRYLSYAQWCARFGWQKSRELGTKAIDLIQRGRFGSY